MMLIDGRCYSRQFGPDSQVSVRQSTMKSMKPYDTYSCFRLRSLMQMAAPCSLCMPFQGLDDSSDDSQDVDHLLPDSQDARGNGAGSCWMLSIAVHCFPSYLRWMNCMTWDDLGFHWLHGLHIVRLPTCTGWSRSGS